jgi:hypothetical protein
VRDLHLRHTLTALARDASAVFAGIVSDGQEIPYEIAEPGSGFAFCQYQPLTAKFVRDNAAELRELESFREATETMRRCEVAATYLEEAGIAPPADAFERSTLAVTYFLARLWDGCSDFEVDEERFSAALAEVEDCAEPESGEVEAIVPLIGFQMDAARVELKGATIVRADTVDVPPEAARGDRSSGGEWEPTFLISARLPLDADGGLGAAGERVAGTFERVVTTLRLFKPGGVGLGPHGWVRVAGDRWRRIATGAGRPRSGGYRLDAEELADLVDLARQISVHPRRVGRLRRALVRFESGVDRRGAIDALNDHLLGLRFLLEGEGPAGVGLPMRAAALATTAEDRSAVKHTVEQAIALERQLWSGEPGGASGSPSEVAVEIEDLLRGILRRGVSGELGGDLRAAADEILLADGLAVGEAAATRGETSEWELEPETAEHAEHDSGEAFERFENDPEAEIVASRTPETGSTWLIEPERDPVAEAAEDELDDHDEAIVEQAIAADSDSDSEPRRSDAEELPNWLEEVDAGPSVTMQFPPRPELPNHIEELSRPPMEREEVKARVQYLFPRTETDWTVGQGGGDRHAATGYAAPRLAHPARGSAGIAEQVGVDLEQPGEVVDVVGQVGDLDHLR